jgi:hypothetical protein
MQSDLCLCSWERFEALPNRNQPFGYFVTEDLWKEVRKVCWNDLVQHECLRAPKGGGQPKKIDSPVLERALADAKKSGKRVLLIGRTGG